MSSRHNNRQPRRNLGKVEQQLAAEQAERDKQFANGVASTLLARRSVSVTAQAARPRRLPSPTIVLPGWSSAIVSVDPRRPGLLVPANGELRGPSSSSCQKRLTRSPAESHSWQLASWSRAAQLPHLRTREGGPSFRRPQAQGFQERLRRARHGFR